MNFFFNLQEKLQEKEQNLKDLSKKDIIVKEKFKTRSNLVCEN